MDKKITSQRSSDNLFKKSKHNSLRNIQNILPEIKLILDSIKANFLDLRLSCSPLNLSDSDSFSSTDPLSEAQDGKKLKVGNRGRFSAVSRCRQTTKLENQESSQITDILTKVYKNVLMINVLMTQFKAYLKNLQTNSVQSSKSFVYSGNTRNIP